MGYVVAIIPSQNHNPVDHTPIYSVQVLNHFLFLGTRGNSGCSVLALASRVFKA